MICPGGFPPGLLRDPKMMHDGMGMPMPQQQHQHGRGVMDDSYCVFTTGFSSAPPPLVMAAFAPLIATVGAVVTRVAAPPGIRLVHVPQARAPPAGA